MRRISRVSLRAIQHAPSQRRQSHRRASHPIGIRQHRTGFTLAEVLIATTLTATLFAGLWTILGIFSKLQLRSETFADRAQITRGLIAQIQDDLDRVEMPAMRDSNQSSSQSPNIRSSSLIPGAPISTPPINGLPSGAATSTSSTTPGGQLSINNPANGSGSTEAELTEFDSSRKPPQTPVIALRGSGSWMIMDLSLSSDELNRHQRTTVANSLSFNPNGDTQAQTPSRKRVLYHAVSPELAMVEDQLRVGLTRWEIPTTVTIGDLVDELNGGEFGTSKSRLWDQFAQPSDGLSAIGNTLETDPSQLTGNPADELDVPREPVPEIERSLFRYFGEGGWQQSWNNSESIPTAIEFLVVWRDSKRESASELANDETAAGDPSISAPSIESGSRTDGYSQSTNEGEELTEARLLAAWEQLGTEQYSSTPVELPSGFARYLFTLPSALVPDRSTLTDSDFFTAGASSFGGMP